MDDCIFCKIATGAIPANKILENDSCFMIRDINPIAPEHLLVIAKEHYANVGELYGLDRMGILHNIFQLIDDYVATSPLEESGYRIITNTGKDAGQTVKHLHFHLLGGATLKNEFGAE